MKMQSGGPMQRIEFLVILCILYIASIFIVRTILNKLDEHAMTEHIFEPVILFTNA